MNLDKKRLHIGVADDDTTLLSMINELLTEEGYVVSAYTDAAHLKKAAYHSPFDIILTDINMPELSGIELLRYLRDELHSKAVVIIMTANAQVQSAIEAVQLGAMDYLQKPFEDINLVIQIVNRAAHKILHDRRQDQMLQAVIEKTQKLISMQKNMAQVPSDLQGLLEKTESMVKELQGGNNGDEKRNIKGAINEIGLPNLLQMLGLVGRPGALHLKGNNWQGEVWFHNGRITHAQCGTVEGEKAVFRVIKQQDGEFSFVMTEENPPKQEIQKSTDGLILDCLRQLDEYQNLGSRIPPPDLFLRIIGAPPKDLHPLDRTVLEYVLRYSRVAEVLDYVPYPDLDAIYSLIRLKVRGVVETYYPK